MRSLFEMVLDASFSGSVVIAVVTVLRLLLKKAPRMLFCLLWLLAGLRLMLPFEIESSFSLQPRREAVAPTIVQQMEMPTLEISYPQEREEILNVQSEVLVQPHIPVVTQPQKNVKPEWNWKQMLPYAWLLGMITLGVASVCSYWRLKYKVREAWRIEESIWECDRIDTAFVLGFFPARIYLPTTLSEEEREYVLFHEKAHIVCHDHWWKLIGYGVLTIHWFNPLVWLGYSLMCRDIEYACDARVVRSMTLQQRKAYSAALLSCGSGHTRIAACPVAFAESDPKHRIRAVLNYKRPGFWISLLAVAAVVFVVVCLLTSPKAEFVEVEIPSLTYVESAQTYRVAERFNPTVRLTGKTEGYESDYASYCFNIAIPASERDACVFYSDDILSRFQLTEKPEIIVLSDYDGAWAEAGKLYIGGNFDSVDYGAKLITLLCGGYANYGAAYGYADYIAVSEGWKQESDASLNLTQQDARDMNWLCFREEFVSRGNIETNKTAAAQFARDYISQYGEVGYQNLLLRSGSTETVYLFNLALSSWYEDQGLEFMPSEILYAMGGSYHDYLVKCPYATFYLPRDWSNGWTSEVTADPEFLHKNYADVKTCFETNSNQMLQLQKSMGFDFYDNDLTVEFMMGTVSQTRTAERLIRINSIEDLPMLYVYWLTLNPMRMRDRNYAQIDSALYVGMAKYIAMNNPNFYESQWLLYFAEHGEQAGIKEEKGWNDALMQVLEGETDPYQIEKKRWDFISYYFDDYYDKPGEGLACSFPLYLIEKYGFETMFDYVYITGREPISLDLTAERDAWIAHLEEVYEGHPKYSNWEAE